LPLQESPENQGEVLQIGRIKKVSADGDNLKFELAGAGYSKKFILLHFKLWSPVLSERVGPELMAMANHDPAALVSGISAKYRAV